MKFENTPNKIEQIESKERLKELEESGNYLFHGSPDIIDTFEPRQAITDVDGQSIADGEPAVFASDEIETPIFRSLFHESNFHNMIGSFVVGFSNSDDSTSYLHANKEAVEVAKNNSGFVYVFNRDDFVFRGNKEWVATKNVKPVAVFESKFEDIELPIHESMDDLPR